MGVAWLIGLRRKVQIPRLESRPFTLSRGPLYDSALQRHRNNPPPQKKKFVHKKLFEDTAQKFQCCPPYYCTGGLFGCFLYFFQYCFICRPSDSALSEDAIGLNPELLRLWHWQSARRSNYSAIGS